MNVYRVEKGDNVPLLDILNVENNQLKRIFGAYVDTPYLLVEPCNLRFELRQAQDKNGFILKAKIGSYRVCLFFKMARNICPFDFERTKFCVILCKAKLRRLLYQAVPGSENTCLCQYFSTSGLD